MNRTVYIIFLSIFFFKTHGQTYMGFMGKRNLVNLNLNIGMSPHPQNNSQNGLLLTYLNSKIEAELERSFNADVSFGGSLRYTKSTYNSGRFRTVLIGGFQDIRDQFYSGEARLNQYTLGGYLKKYIKKTGGISPSGKYIQYGINYHMVNIGEKSLYYMEENNVNTIGLDYDIYELDTIKSCNYISVLIGFGNHRIVKWKDNYFVINTSVCANLSTDYLKTFIDIEAKNTIDVSPTIKRYLAEFDFITAKIGVGYLF